MSSDYSKELPRVDSTLQSLNNTQTIEPTITTTYRGRTLSVGENPSNIENKDKPTEAWREAIAFRPSAPTISSEPETSQFSHSASTSPKNNLSTREKISKLFNKFSKGIKSTFSKSNSSSTSQVTQIESNRRKESALSISHNSTTTSSNNKENIVSLEERIQIRKGIDSIDSGGHEMGVQILLKTSQGNTALEKAAKSGYVTETMDFFKDQDSYNQLVENIIILSKNGIDVSDLKLKLIDKYMQIMNSYIKENSATPINMDGNLRMKLEIFEKELQKPDHVIDLNKMQNQFDPARSPLERDLGASFQKSQAFADLKESLAEKISSDNIVPLTPMETLTESKATLAKANADFTLAEKTLNKTKTAIFKNKNSIAKAQANVTKLQTAVETAEKKVILAALEVSPIDLTAILQTKIGRMEVAAFFTKSQSMENLQCLDKLQACNALIESRAKKEDIINAYNDIIVSHIWKDSDMQVNMSDFQRDDALLHLSLEDGTIDMAGIQNSLNNFEQHLIKGMREPYVQDLTGSIALKNKYTPNK